ncbi:hypothetical protein HYH02_003891 [Chlamydomonas schloesseri]|uniref:CobW C-terminal domain-containing protein n=1 Tax=Chlamydomonas schloesseri TaxID=2026947 RepID=A0A835WPI1_9CHLO|nr:hypothetical protein HYH02_003891 [Chlamydomonas schloesseri]|eukprot:KAG2451285.1 hypothetical protein HYH02_003891 [Chlamydomonas schloesseri]
MQLLKVSDEVEPAPAAVSVAVDDSLVSCESPRLCGKRAAECFFSQQNCKRRPSVEMRRDMLVESATGARGSGEDARELQQPSVTCKVSAPGTALPRGISAVSVMAEGPLDEYRFNMFMNDLLSERRNDIVGFKGVLCVQGCGDTRFAIRGSRRAIRYGPAGQAWRSEEPRISRMVFIGRGLDQKDLAAGFRTCVAATSAQAKDAL